MLLVPLVLDSQLSQCQRSARKNSQSETVTTRGPEIQLCSARTHIGANSVHAFAPHVAYYEKVVIVHQNVILQAFMEEVARRATPRQNPPASKT